MDHLVLPSWASDWHDLAMDRADDADILRRRGEKPQAEIVYEQACQYETAVALACEPTCQPSRSVLLRSAASLALHAGWKQIAYQLAAAGLQSDTPGEIADELRDVLASSERSAIVRPPVWVYSRVQIDLPLPDEIDRICVVEQRLLDGALFVVRCYFADNSQMFPLYVPANALFTAAEEPR